MIPLDKLFRIPGKARQRKAALLLAEAERILRGPLDAPAALSPDAGEAAAYVKRLAERLSRDGEAADPVREAATLLAGLPADPGSQLRAAAALRHALIAATGQAAADWDLLDPLSGRPDPASRRTYPGLFAYLEDIRSPFNVGSMLRSADAFGLSGLILSPGAADPGHPRAARSSMGAAELVPWSRAGLEALEGRAAFALELGGCPIDDFDFPESGIVVVGSEELGVSPEALARCGLGAVSIPMAGAKGSLNVGVAFGVLLHAWGRSLARRGIHPQPAP